MVLLVYFLLSWWWGNVIRVLGSVLGNFWLGGSGVVCCCLIIYVWCLDRLLV